jgi:adenylyl cyclase-associated protein
MIELLNCFRVQVHCVGFVPALQIDNCSEIHIHLSEASLKTKIVSSKSSEVNINFPGQDKETVTDVVPWQYETTIVDGKLVSQPSELL